MSCTSHVPKISLVAPRRVPAAGGQHVWMGSLANYDLQRCFATGGGDKIRQGVYGR